MLALVEAQNAAPLARFNDARLAGHRDVLAAFYDRGSGDIDAHVGLVTLYQLWRFENGLDPGQSEDGFDRVYIPRQDHRRRW